MHVDIHRDAYLEEIATGKQTLKNCNGNDVVIPIMKFSEKDLESVELKYDTKNQMLRDFSQGVATTLGKHSKGLQNTQAFVMSKEGNLYIATHDAVQSLGKNEKRFTHAALLNGVIVEMAGLISINEQGKISMINNNSGHYSPQAMDMYRGIKKLQGTMPNVFSTNCIVTILPDGKEKNINEFIDSMEAIQYNGKTLYQNLVEYRQKRILLYNEYIKKGPFKLVGSSISDGIRNLSEHEKLELKNRLEIMPNTIFKLNKGGKYKFFSKSQLINYLIELNKKDVIQILMNLNINIIYQTPQEADLQHGDSNEYNLIEYILDKELLK